MRQLVTVAQRLKVIYGIALSAELALRKQDAEQDVDIAECLRSGVCIPSLSRPNICGLSSRNSERSSRSHCHERR